MKTQLLVIGSGPGGYAAAFRAADLGLNVVLVDKRDSIGGVCLNEGCIPSKALLHVAEVIREAKHASELGITFSEPVIDLDKVRAHKDALVGTLTGGLGGIARRRKVTQMQGEARFTGPHTVSVEGESIDFDHVIIAVGSTPVSLPNWPVDPRIWDSTRALELPEIPKRMTIVGAGIIGLEMATLYAALGSKVTLVELAEKMLPDTDAESAKVLHKAMVQQGCEFHFGTAVTDIDTSSAVIRLTTSKDTSIEADVVISAVGRRSNAGKINTEACGLTLSRGDIIDVDAQSRTAVSHIFAIGDVTGMPMLAHRATHQGKIAAEVIAGHNVQLNTQLIPSVAYTSPEFAWIGLSLEEAKAAGYQAKASSFPWLASGRNLASGGQDGLTKLVYDETTGRVLGGSLVGKNAGELLAEVTLAIEMGATLEDLALTIHAHPTLSETIAFAAERALGSLTDL
ncbi:dihydrolipoyl dehydrogenase [Reinekea sp.]|jgi:dihydrolipoamide dehydrogenase|uniref:dihydrolipoyl dehydrogenase n=1 Tax=Reinekea sp. TaxID=1970455 RepID=UPI002A80EE52|nr:dihydrolipoyl dehydrogenase [Reinekea sp.]